MNQPYYLNHIYIKSFRGLNELKMNSFAPVNLILGENNCGKTSFLEAVYFSACEKFNDLRYFVRLRHERPDADDIYYIYSRNDKNIDIDYDTTAGPISIKSHIKRNKIFFDKEIFLDGLDDSNISKKRIEEYINFARLNGKETNQFVGEYHYNNNNEKFSYIPFDFRFQSFFRHRYSKKVVYVSPYQHFNISNLNLEQIIKNEDYYKLFIQLLKMFDEEIEGILYLPGDDMFSSAELHIKHKGLEPEPVSLYGDGIKKAIALAYSLLFAKNGILLIDELETSLHHSFLNDIFAFLLEAAKHFNIQVFITTHSEETVDELLKIGNEINRGFIKSYTLKKHEGKVYARDLSSEEAIKLRETIDYDIRG